MESRYIQCPLCAYQMDRDVFNHLFLVHGLRLPLISDRGYTCYCGAMAVQHLGKFYEHFRRHGQQCVIIGLLTSEGRGV